ncbi:MAG: hypothetical protein ABSF29_10360 [Tepidisphaeraceae bacterium]|jgi:hypothetical protein
MSRRSSIFATIISTLAALLPAAAARAEDAVQSPQVENSKYQFEGAVNTSAVFVRSGPGEGYYATQKLEKGATVTVVGIKFDWLKIVPPEGSFSYVGSVFVDRSGDGSVGRVNRNDVNVRCGSLLNEMKTTVQTHLNAGDEVQIIGKDDEYLKIKPPQDSYLYVSKEFVDPVRALGGSDASAPLMTETPTTQASPLASAAPTPPAAPVNPNAPSIDNSAVGTATPPAATTQPAVASAAPTTQPVAVVQPSAEDLFGQYEAEFDAASQQPLADQNIGKMTSEYQSIAKADGLSDTLRTVVAFRIETLQVRAQSQAKLLEARKMEAAAAQKELALQAEQQELSERLKATDVAIYTAVGTLQPSSLQLGGATLYRLTDPATGRTVIYLRTADTTAAGLMGQFVGVKGDASTDPQLSLQVIEPTAIEIVDPAKVNTAVAAEFIPPSLLARQASATFTGN